MPERTGRRGTRQPLLIAGVAALLGALLAVPLVASAQDDPSEEALPGEGRSVEECARRWAEAELPRATEFLDDLVADGVVDQAQADEIERRAREEAEYRCVARGLFTRRDAFRVTIEETGAGRRAVLHELRHGESLASIAADESIGEADLLAAMLAEPRAEAAVLVAAGELTQAEADELLAEIESYAVEVINAEGLRDLRALRW